uniref:Uncharacterized protein n=1 Tax=Siphoviridae sp. ctL0q1 TaxID=2825449 RepID=A0A8S5PKP6_9CAUD|nr:MAG TPA: hypothetical protein [Siphoviridae sp. ctL0q1]
MDSRLTIESYSLNYHFALYNILHLNFSRWHVLNRSTQILICWRS